MQRTGSLEIPQDQKFQERYWKLQRIAWIGMVIMLILAFLGLFGSGPLSHATIGNEDDPLQLKFQRFGLFHAPTTLEVHIGGDRVASEETEVQLELSRAYLDGVQIESIEPEPERVVAIPGGVNYVFLRGDPLRSTRIQIHLMPETYGLLRGEVSLKDGPSLDFLQWIYP